MELPSYNWPGQPSYGEWMQSIDPNREGQTYSPKQHPNPRMRNINPRGMMGGIEGLEQETSGLWQTWKKILERTGNEDLANQWLSGQQTAAADTGIGSTNEYQMAKVYTNQMPGMIDEGFFWDSLTPEAEAINKVLNMPGIEGMKQGSESDWNYDDYNKMIPDWLREQLPEEAFENLDDFRNQQRITT